ncbi:MAG: ATP-grasp domain-containing protein [Rhodospirillales bacterium]
MYRLTEDKAKARLRDFGLPVPDGVVAATPEEAAAFAENRPGGVVVKALVPTGRRGKAGAVKSAATPKETADAARAILGQTVHGYRVEQVYVEARIPIADEFYLSFAIERFPPQVLVSRAGGVDIEETHRTDPEAIIAADIDPLKGLDEAQAQEVWRRAGIGGDVLADLGRVTSELFRFYQENDGVTLEINPLAVDAEGRLSLVGAMVSLEDPMFLDPDSGGMAMAGRPLTERERRVAEANKAMPGGMMRFTELDGDIGMYVGGGGSSLLQHDLVLAAGGRPANHTDSSTTNEDKVAVLIEAILDHPKVKSLLVSWHFQQMGRIDRRVLPVVKVLKERGIDPRKFPVVLHMFGPGEKEAREVCATLPGMHYLDHGSPIEEGVELIVKLTKELDRKGAAS